MLGGCRQGCPAAGVALGWIVRSWSSTKRLMTGATAFLHKNPCFGSKFFLYKFYTRFVISAQWRLLCILTDESLQCM